MGLFVLFEGRRFFDDRRIQDFMENPACSLSLKLERSTWQIPSVIRNEEALISISQKVKKAAADGRELALFFQDSASGQEERTRKKEKIQKIADLLESLDRLVTSRLNGDEEIAQEFENNVRALRAEARDLSLSAAEERNLAANEWLARIDKEKRQRSLLAVVALLSGFALVIVLVKAVEHYKETAERALGAEQVNALFAAALQSTRVGVLIRDMRNKAMPVVFANKAFEDMTGYKLSEIPGDSTFLFGWKTDPETIEAYRRAVSLRESATFNLMVYRKDGSPFWSEWHASPISGSEGESFYYVSLFTDMTAFRQTQEELILAKQTAERASAIKTNFLAMMSHEIRTPINGIQGVLKLIDETALDGEQKHLLDIAITSSRALHRIINDILDYAKMEAGKVEIINETFSVKTLLDETMGIAGPMRGNKKVELEVQTGAGLPEAFLGDIGRIQQVLLNLVSNAIKFTDDGFVHIRVLPLLEQKMGERDGLLVRFEVQDSGIGISPDDQEKLFKEFSQVERSYMRRFGGTGLGLAICKRIVAMLGGEIGVESQPGKGSRFWFMIPLEIAKVVENQRHDEFLSSGNFAEGRSPQSCLILLTEDNETNRLVAKSYLTKAGFNVEEACNGLEAVQKAKEKKYDLILMDISMPEMDGMMATCRIREAGGENAKVPIVALTAHVMAGDRDLCLEAGMNDYLNKPIDYKALLKVLERWLRVSLKERDSDKKEKLAREVDDSPDFDKDLMERMRSDLGTKAVCQIIDTFLKDSPHRLEALRSERLDVVRDGAHTMKSGAANCGLMKFSKLMAVLERHANNGLTEEVSSLVSQIGPVLEAGLVKVGAYRKALVDGT